MGSDDDDIHCSDYDVGDVDDDVYVKLRLRGKVHGKSGRGRKRGPDWTSVFQEGQKGRRREQYSSFYRTRVRSLGMLVSNSLTHSLTP